MLLDRFLPEFDVRTQHVIRVDAPPGQVYASLWSTDFDHWGVTRSASRWRFRAYWTLIRPFSGLIRRELLAAVRVHAETTRAVHS